MRRGLLALAVAGALAAPAAADAAPDRTTTVSLAAPVASWAGVATVGLNNTYYEGDQTGRSACGKSIADYCDSTLVHVDDTYTGTKKLTFRLDGFQVSDYDLRVTKSDATGARGTYEGDPVGDGAGLTPLATFNGDFETKPLSGVRAGAFYLVDIVYFSTVPTETPSVKATLK